MKSRPNAPGLAALTRASLGAGTGADRACHCNPRAGESRQSQANRAPVRANRRRPVARCCAANASSCRCRRAKAPPPGGADRPSRARPCRHPRKAYASGAHRPGPGSVRVARIQGRQWVKNWTWQFKCELKQAQPVPRAQVPDGDAATPCRPPPWRWRWSPGWPSRRCAGPSGR